MSLAVLILTAGCVASLILLILTIFSIYILYRRYTQIDQDQERIAEPIPDPCPPIRCDDTKNTAITVSQPMVVNMPKRSQSVDSDALREYVTLAIDSQSSHATSPMSHCSKLSGKANHHGADHDEDDDDDDDDATCDSPLSSAKSHKIDTIETYECNTPLKLKLQDDGNMQIYECFDEDLNEDVKEEEMDSKEQVQETSDDNKDTNKGQNDNDNDNISSDSLDLEQDEEPTEFTTEIDAELVLNEGSVSQATEFKLGAMKFRSDQSYMGTESEHKTTEETHTDRDIESPPKTEEVEEESRESKDVIVRIWSDNNISHAIMTRQPVDVNVDMNQKITEYEHSINILNRTAQKKRRKSVSDLNDTRIVQSRMHLFEQQHQQNVNQRES